MRRFIALAVFATSALGAAQAADETGQFFIMGTPGAMTCADFVAKKDTGTVGGDYGNWLGGYVSALNRQLPGVYNLVDGIQMADFYNGVVELCGQFPQMHVEEVTYNLLIKSHDAHIKSGTK